MIIDDLCYTEIRDFYPVIMNKDIFWLYIPMYDITIFEKLQRDDDLGDEPSYDLIRKSFLVFEDEVL